MPWPLQYINQEDETYGDLYNSTQRRQDIDLLKDLITPQNANVFVGKLGTILEKAIDKPLGYAINWGRIWSLWPVHIETACCSVEFGAASSPRYDVERFGIIEAFGSLRQCDPHSSPGNNYQKDGTAPSFGV